jgi:hypothetical protein
MDQTYEPSEPQPLSSPSSLLPSPPPLLPALLPTNTSTTLGPLACPPLAIYSTREALFEAIQSWSKLRGYAFTVGKSLRKTGRQKVYYACDRCPPTPLPKERIRGTQTRGTGCLFSVIALEKASGEWELKYRPEPQYNTHNHLPSQSPISHPSHRHLSTEVKNIAQSFFSAGIQPRQNPDANVSLAVDQFALMHCHHILVELCLATLAQVSVTCRLGDRGWREKRPHCRQVPFYLMTLYTYKLQVSYTGPNLFTRCDIYIALCVQRYTGDWPAR